MARPTITANTGTGSDTAASGCGHTAITAGGNDGASLNASTTVDLSADAPDLSAVAADASSGTWCLWVGTSSGRQFSRITGADNTAKTVTVATAYGVTESGKTWGIGGKRATWTVAMFADAQAGWTLVTETDQTVSAALTSAAAGDTTDGPITVKGDSATSRRTITQSTNSLYVMAIGHSLWIAQNLLYASSAATKGGGIGLSGTTFTTVQNCVFGGASNSLASGLARTGNAPTVVVVSCEFYNTSTSGVYIDSGALYMTDCFVHACGGAAGSGLAGVRLAGSGPGHFTRCVFAANSDYGLNTAATSGSVTHCTFDANASVGLQLTSTAPLGWIVRDNLFTNHSGAGDKATSLTAACGLKTGFLADFNAFYNNLVPDSNYPAGANDVALGASPYADANFATTYDFAVTSALLSLGGPPAAAAHLGLNSATHSYMDIGAAQRSPTADEASRNTDPGEANVKSGTSYKIANVAKNGSYAGGGGGSRAWASIG